MKKLLLVIGLIGLLLLPSGCATSPYAAARKAGIAAVAVEPQVTVARSMRYGYPPHTHGAGLTGALTGVVVDAVYAGRLEEMSALMEDNGIELEEIVYKRFVGAIGKELEMVSTAADADGVFVLRIDHHGFADAGLSPTRKLPVVLLGARLVDRNGEVVWRGSSTISHIQRRGIASTWEEYKEQPDQLRADWERQVDGAVRGLLRSK